MEFDFDYDIAYWNGENLPISDRAIEIIKAILKSDLEEFSERQIANLLETKRVRLENLWKAGLLKKYEAIKSSTRPQCIYALDYQSILYALSGDLEIRDLLQERARRQQSLVQADRLRPGYRTNDCRVSHRAFTKRRPY